MGRTITLTKAKLKSIISETINYMFDCTEKVMRYIKSFGTKGKLPSVDEPLSVYYENALSTAYKWACESVEGASRDGFVYFKHNFIVNVLRNFTFSKRGLIYVERSIDLDISKGFDDLEFKSIGECWSWKRGNAQSYCADFSIMNNNIIQVVVCGYVHPSSIDWIETIYLNSYKMKSEREIRMNNNAFVEVSYIRIYGRVYRFGTSFLINARADKYSH